MIFVDFHRTYVRYIKTKGRNGYEAFFDRIEVSTAPAFVVITIAADPVIFSASRVDSFVDNIIIYSFAEPCHGKTFEHAARKVRNIDVGKRSGRRLPLAQRIDHPGGDPGGVIEEELPACANRDRHRRDIEKGAFLGGGDGPRVVHVLAHVRPGIYAGHDEVGPSRQDGVHAEKDAVGRGAVRGVHAFRNLTEPKRLVERDRVGDARALPLGCYHIDVVLPCEVLRERQDAFRVDAVIVGKQDKQELPVLGK